MSGLAWGIASRGFLGELNYTTVMISKQWRYWLMDALLLSSVGVNGTTVAHPLRTNLDIIPQSPGYDPDAQELSTKACIAERGKHSG